MTAAVAAWEEFRQTGMLDALRPNRMAALLHALFAACVRWEALWPKVRGGVFFLFMCVGLCYFTVCLGDLNVCLCVCVT